METVTKIISISAAKILEISNKKNEKALLKLAAKEKFPKKGNDFHKIRLQCRKRPQRFRFMSKS